MTKAQIEKRISQFNVIVDDLSEKIHKIGNASWDSIAETDETKAVRAFLIQKGAGIDYLNRRLAPLLKQDGRVVKTKNPKTGCKKPNGICELADLQTVFLYLDSDNEIRRIRCVLFQAKRKPNKGTHVIGAKDVKQRRLYDTCGGFSYVTGIEGKNGEDRRLPKGASRKRALQYLFVEPRPVIAITTPSDQGKGKSAEYGAHLFQFLKDKTGLKAETKKSAWGKIVWELMDRAAKTLEEDRKIKGKGVKGMLKAFNNFESHDTWCIDSGPCDDGYGVQLVIVWDGDIPPAEPQKIVRPKTPVKRVEVTVSSQKKKKIAEEEEELEEPEVVEVEREWS